MAAARFLRANDQLLSADRVGGDQPFGLLEEALGPRDLPGDFSRPIVPVEQLGCVVQGIQLGPARGQGLARLLMPLVKSVELLPARTRLPQKRVDTSLLDQLPGLLGRLQSQARAGADLPLNLVPGFHHLQPAAPEVVEIVLDLVIERQRGAGHRRREVRVGAGQGLVPLPQAVDLIHERHGLLAESPKLRVHGALELALAIVKHTQHSQADQAQDRENRQGGAARGEIAYRKPERRGCHSVH